MCLHNIVFLLSCFRIWWSSACCLHGAMHGRELLSVAWQGGLAGLHNGRHIMHNQSSRVITLLSSTLKLIKKKKVWIYHILQYDFSGKQWVIYLSPIVVSYPPIVAYSGLLIPYCYPGTLWKKNEHTAMTIFDLFKALKHSWPD